ncbi:hypothetical protein LG3211_1101 [Lysobacter gummosus]|nr:hypothetical protein LG3211_1101 [Lysobacter gummosus]
MRARAHRPARSGEDAAEARIDACRSRRRRAVEAVSAGESVRDAHGKRAIAAHGGRAAVLRVATSDSHSAQCSAPSVAAALGCRGHRSASRASAPTRGIDQRRCRLRSRLSASASGIGEHPSSHPDADHVGSQTTSRSVPRKQNGEPVRCRVSRSGAALPVGRGRCRPRRVDQWSSSSSSSA